jgi:hypothetical protein
MAFLLDDALSEDHFLKAFATESPQLAYFTLGVRHLALGDLEKAKEALSVSLHVGNDEWLAAAARARVKQCEDNIREQLSASEKGLTHEK